jgi:hypothetical protein
VFPERGLEAAMEIAFMIVSEQKKDGDTKHYTVWRLDSSQEAQIKNRIGLLTVNIL